MVKRRYVKNRKHESSRRNEDGGECSGAGSSKLFGTWVKMLNDISSGPNLASTENTILEYYIYPHKHLFYYVDIYA